MVESFISGRGLNYAKDSQKVAKTLFENNEAFITVTKMNHQDALRCCIINYEITEESLDCVINAIKCYIDKNKDLTISQMN